jgi:hypothetical protein
MAAAGLISAQTNNAVGSVAFSVTNPLSITKTADLNFGAIVSPAQSSVVEIDAVKNSTTGTRTGSSGVQFADNNFSQAIFTVQGAPNAIFFVSPIPATSISAGNNYDMPVTFYNLAYQDQFPSPNPMVTLYIGASLTLGAFQPKGNYSGTFTVQVNYQ